MNFKIVLEKDEDGIYVTTCPSLPGCFSQGETAEEATENMRKAIILHIKCLAEDGIPITPSKTKIEKIVSVNI